MIPKIIHYCWLSDDPMPSDLKRYMKTWEKKLPDYEFMLWDRKRFCLEDHIWPYQAFMEKKYAFAADYIRLYALYHYGGIYLDTDVEVLKSFNPLLSLDMIIGYDHHDHSLEAATWGASIHNPLIEKLLNYYDTNNFKNADGSLNTLTMPDVIIKCLDSFGIQFQPVKTIEEAKQITDKHLLPIFPRSFFCPQNWYTYKLEVTEDTYSIHHYKGGWLPDDVRKEREILRHLGPYLPRLWRKFQGWYFKLKKDNRK